MKFFGILMKVKKIESFCEADDFCLVMFRSFDDGQKKLISKVSADSANLEGKFLS